MHNNISKVKWCPSADPQLAIVCVFKSDVKWGGATSIREAAINSPNLQIPKLLLHIFDV